MKRLVRGVGINDADYKVTWQDENGKQVMCPVYRKWVNMLTRAYDKKFHIKYPTYIGATVSEEWLRFSVFSNWLVKQPRWQNRAIDKDILISGNKLYSKESCLLIPQHINKLLNDNKASKGKFATGVSYHKQRKKYQANINIDGKQKHLGYFTTPSQAEIAYLIAKSDEIARQAQPFKHTEPKLYQALIAHSCHFFDDYLSA